MGFPRQRYRLWSQSPEAVRVFSDSEGFQRQRYSGSPEAVRGFLSFSLPEAVRVFESREILKTDSGYPKDTGVNKPWQPLGIPFAITPIGQLLSFFCSSRGCTCLSFTLSFFDVENERIFLSSFDVEN